MDPITEPSEPVLPLETTVRDVPMETTAVAPPRRGRELPPLRIVEDEEAV
jgi:hypothetical protein